MSDAKKKLEEMRAKRGEVKPENPIEGKPVPPENKPPNGGGPKPPEKPPGWWPPNCPYPPCDDGEVIDPPVSDGTHLVDPILMVDGNFELQGPKMHPDVHTYSSSDGARVDAEVHGRLSRHTRINPCSIG